MSTLTDAAGLLLGVATNILMFFMGVYWQRIRHRTKQRQLCPYQWRCPRRGCEFECGSNDVMLTDYMATSHQQDHVREGT